MLQVGDIIQEGHWKGFELLSIYTRKEAIEDGALIDVTEAAKEAGIKWPVALTDTVYNMFVEIPRGLEGEGQSISGRLWDILTMFRYAAKNGDGSEILFKLGVRNRPGITKTVTLKSVCGPGDNMEPVITIMLPEED